MKKNKSKMKGKIIVLSYVLLFTTITACENFIEVGPPKTEIVTETVFTSDGSATAAISGIYSLMMNNQSFTRSGIEEFSGLLSDELTNYAMNADQIQFHSNTLTAKNGYVLAIFWREAYRYINNANAVIEGLQVSQGLTLSTKNQLEGEAYFIRAFCHFYLVTMFGDIPYLTVTDYRVNMNETRLSKDQVFNRIELDLLTARDLMASDFSFSSERVRPNRDAATALLARLYLYTGVWNKAEALSSELILNNSSYQLEELPQVFLKESREVIWQLKPIVPEANTPQAQVFILTGPPNTASRRVTMSDNLYQSFEQVDDRLSEWVGEFTQDASTWHFPYKYKKLSDPIQSEYSVVFRLAEQYLINAEALTRQGKFAQAQQALNAVRERAGLQPTLANDEANLLTAIEHERRVELFAEWGHRWLDLIRYNHAQVVLGPIKSDWEPTDILLPIPDSERQLNPNLSQNPGY